MQFYLSSCMNRPKERIGVEFSEIKFSEFLLFVFYSFCFEIYGVMDEFIIFH